MSAKPLSSAVLLSLVLAWPAAAQQPMQPIEVAPAPAAVPPNSANALLQNGFTPLANTAGARWAQEAEALSVGRDGPVGQEIYFETGPTIPIGNGVFGLYLNTGWMIEGGGRVLFFTPGNDGALTAKLGLTYQENLGTANAPTYKFFTIDVRTRSLVRVSGLLAFGWDWFRQGKVPFGTGAETLRFGADAGMRWGTEILRMDVINDPIENTTFRHRSRTYGGVVVGLHADVEVPIQSFVWFGGLRFEYGYNWSNIVPGQNSNLHDVNILLSTGFRY